MLVCLRGTRPCISVVLQAVANESSLWCLAGSSAVHELLIRSLNLDTYVKVCLDVVESLLYVVRM